MGRSIVITCYYWPPSGGGGVLRWLRLSAALCDAGFNVTVLAPAGADYPLQDPQLVRQVHPRVRVERCPIIEPYGLYRRLTKRPPDEAMRPDHAKMNRRGWREVMATLVRGNFFVPDARVGWTVPAARYLGRLHRQQPFDTIITTGPPHSLHLIGAWLQRSRQVHWVADFRDPWTGIEYHDDLRLLPPARKTHRLLERQVLMRADRVVTVSPTWAKELAQIGGRHVDVIENGFDGNIPSRGNVPAEDFVLIRHLGLLGQERAPPALWRALARYASGSPLSIEFIGTVDNEVIEASHRAGLRDIVRTTPSVPHQEALAAMATSTLLLLSVAPGRDANGRIPGKLFEYLSSGRPILALCEESSDVASIIRETGGGLSASPFDEHAIFSAISELARWKCSRVTPQSLHRFQHSELAKRYAEIL